MATRVGRKSLIGGVAVAIAAAGVLWFSASKSDAAQVVVYKTPTCGCCTKWADHLRENGFSVRTEDVADLSTLKRHRGVGQELSACHTALVDGYVVEGHVPADVVRQLLEERPPVVGIAVPGMPLGSPGMESAHTEPYEVLAFDGDGNTYVFARRGAR
jgi:hypothetical protein